MHRYSLLEQPVWAQRDAQRLQSLVARLPPAPQGSLLLPQPGPELCAWTDDHFWMAALSLSFASLLGAQPGELESHLASRAYSPDQFDGFLEQLAAAPLIWQPRSPQVVDYAQMHEDYEAELALGRRLSREVPGPRGRSSGGIAPLRQPELAPDVLRLCHAAAQARGHDLPDNVFRLMAHEAAHSVAADLLGIAWTVNLVVEFHRPAWFIWRKDWTLRSHSGVVTLQGAAPSLEHRARIALAPLLWSPWSDLSSSDLKLVAQTQLAEASCAWLREHTDPDRLKARILEWCGALRRDVPWAIPEQSTLLHSRAS